MDTAHRNSLHYIWSINQEYFFQHSSQPDLMHVFQRATLLHTACLFNNHLLGIQYSEYVLARLTYLQKLLRRSRLVYAGHSVGDVGSRLHLEIHWHARDLPFYDTLLDVILFYGPRSSSFARYLAANLQFVGDGFEFTRFY